MKTDPLLAFLEKELRSPLVPLRARILPYLPFGTLVLARIGEGGGVETCEVHVQGYPTFLAPPPGGYRC